MKFVLPVLIFAAIGCSKNYEAPTNLISDSQPYIIGGQTVTETDTVTRSTVALRYMSKSGATSQICSGTLISKDAVLTAAHCVGYGTTKTVVAFGIVNTDSPFDAKSMRKLSAIAVHPLYDDVTSRLNDIAVLKLDSEAPATYVPVSILASTVVLKNGMPMLLAGFGVTDDVKGTDAPVLKKVSVPLVKIVEDSILVTDQTTNNGACNGDSGGPAYYELKGKLFVYGVTRGPYEDVPDCHHYGEYTYASYFQTFIEKAVKDMAAESPVFESAVVIQ